MNVDIDIDASDALKAVRDKVAKCDPHRLATRVAVPLERHWRQHLAGMPHNKDGYPSTGFWEDAARRVIGRAVGPAVELSSDKLGLRQRLHGGPIDAVNANNLTIPICAEAYGTSVADWGRDNLTLVILGDGRKFLALWLGSPDVQRRFGSTVGAALRRYQRRQERMKAAGRRTGVPAVEPKNRAVGRFKQGLAMAVPRVIVFKSSGGGARDASRAERHADLKFLFVLKPHVEQAANPDVVPSDLQEVAIREANKAIET